VPVCWSGGLVLRPAPVGVLKAQSATLKPDGASFAPSGENSGSGSMRRFTRLTNAF
jgi:hypothetical protein